ncbi:MAG: hypothetical protein ACMG6H_04930, partial [Acidobacteriota bacterium]
MKWARHKRVRTLLASVAIIAAIATLVVRLSRMTGDGRKNVATLSNTQSPGASPAGPSPTEPQKNSAEAQPNQQSVAPSQNSTSPTVPSLPSPAGLIIPVAGVRPEQLHGLIRADNEHLV